MLPAARQPLIAQDPAANQKQYPPMHGGLQLSKIAKKTNHVPYEMLEMLSSFIHIFLASFTKCAFTWINSISEIQSISPLTLAFNSSNVWGFVAYTFSKTLIDKNRKQLDRGIVAAIIFDYKNSLN